MRYRVNLLVLSAVLVVLRAASGGDGNRLAYLEENNPWYPHTGFARLTTPQWVGDEGVEAVVILAIDDMRDTAKYEAYLRPILQRLKAIDGRAPVSIMTCDVKPDDPQLQSWLGEGLSIECHTVDHPCPLLQGGDFEKAKSTYDRCVDTLNQIPGNTPVAFRTPCCDSLNTVSPRFFAEIFNARTPGGHNLQIDSSVFCVFTEDDPEIPAELLTDPDGTPKFKKYLPTGLERNGVVHNEFVNWIENYPYPYVINNSCWEFPCMVPSDWEANFHHQPNNPDTVRDMQAALDITVLKQGVFCMVFHPHGWIRAEQMVEFIDHAVETHGEKVKFLTFREALARLNENLLDGHPVRNEEGLNNGVKILDVDNDRHMDVVIANRDVQMTRRWTPDSGEWVESTFPVPLVLHQSDSREGFPTSGSLRSSFGVASDDGAASFIEFTWRNSPEFATNRPHAVGRMYRYSGGGWKHVSVDASRGPLAALRLPDVFDLEVQWRDIDHDGFGELLVVGRDSTRLGRWHLTVLQWYADDLRWVDRPWQYATPFHQGLPLSAVRFADIDNDGDEDLIMIHHDGQLSIHLFEDGETGWSDRNSASRFLRIPTEEPAPRGRRPLRLPPIVRRDGTDNGFFIHSGYLLWQNEDTANLPDMVEKRSIAELLGSVSETK